MGESGERGDADPSQPVTGVDAASAVGNAGGRGAGDATGIGEVPGPVVAEDLIEIADGDVTWRVDPGFLRSRWTCTWGRGCQGIRSEPAADLQQGCCSVGAELDGAEEGAALSAYAALLEPDRFQHHAAAARDGVFADERRLSTRVVDGACIFLNRPGFDGGLGCALHLAALDAGEPPLEWKPSVCWQLPIKVDWTEGDRPGTEVATVRGWTRADWNEEGDEMAWCCTEEPESYVGDGPVVDSLAEELTEILGPAVHVELRHRLARERPDADGSGPDPF